jgi:hypothetical protein
MRVTRFAAGARRCAVLRHAVMVALVLVSVARADIYSDLADTLNLGLGDALVGLKQPFTGAVPRTVHAKLAESLSVEDFGAVGNGVADDTAAIQNALYAASPNGTVKLSRSGRYRVLANLTVPVGVTLMGDGFVAGTDGSYTNAYFNARGSLIYLSSSASIWMYASSCLSDIYILRDGISIPTASNAAFAGTCINVDATSNWAKCDVILRNLLIIGFNQAVYSVLSPRLIAENVCFDCNNGFYIAQSGDPVRLEKCHGWPYATVAYTPYTPAQIQRPGIAYYLLNRADAGKLSNCFSFGYATGFKAQDANGVHFVNCGADNEVAAGNPTSVGFSIAGESDHVGMFNCQAVCHNSPLSVAMSTNLMTLNMTGCLLGYAPGGSAVNLTTGGINMTGCTFYYADRAVAIHGASARLNMSSCYAQSNIINEVIANFGNSPYVQINGDNYFQDATVPVFNSGGGVPVVASASGVALPRSGELIQVTGSTNIFSLSNGWPGRRVTLLFTGTLTLTDSAGMQMAGNFAATANSTITFVFTSATQCYEVARAKN